MTFSENSNYDQESLLELENNKFVDNAQQCFSVTPDANFLHMICIFTEGVGDGIESRLHFKIFSTLFMANLKIDLKAIESVFKSDAII